MKSKMIRLALLLSIALLVVVGVTVSAPKQITVGVEAGGPYSIFYKKMSAEFTKATGIQVNFIDVPHENMHERFLTEAIAGTGAIDVFQVDQPWTAEFAAARFLEPLGNRISAEDRSDFSQVALDTATYNGELYALPYLVHNSVLYYRSDLFKKAGLQGPPTTWEEYRQYAKKLTDGDVSGTLIEGKQHPEPAVKFLDILYQAGGRVLDDEGKVAINSQAALDAFNFMLAIQYDDKSSPRGAPGFDCTDMHNLFIQGKLAMAPNWPYMISMADSPEQSKVVGQYEIAVQPGNVARGGAVFSWGFGVSSDSKNKEAAWEFVKWATSTEMLARLGKAFTNPVARSSSMEAIMADPEVGERAKNMIKVMTESVSISRTIPMIPEWPSLQSRLELTVSRIMGRQVTPEEELKATEKDMREILGL